MDEFLYYIKTDDFPPIFSREPDTRNSTLKSVAEIVSLE